MKKRTPLQAVGQYVWNNLISLDQQLNAIWAGDPQETVSSRLGKIKRAYGGKIPWYRPWPRIVAHALDKIQKDHCTRSINDNEGSDGLFL